MSRVFANGPGDQGSISGRVIPKTQKMVLDPTLLNTQQYKVRIKGKVEQSRELSSALPYTSVSLAIEKGAFGSPSTKVANFACLHYQHTHTHTHLYIHRYCIYMDGCCSILLSNFVFPLLVISFDKQLSLKQSIFLDLVQYCIMLFFLIHKFGWGCIISSHLNKIH